MKDHFRRTVKADGEVAGAGAGGGVTPEGSGAPASTEEGSRNFLHRDEGPASGKADLPAMGVATEHEAETGVPGSCGDLGAVAEENPRKAAGTSPGGGLHGAGPERICIINPGEGKVTFPVTENNRFVDQEAEPEALEAGGELKRVMVPENSMDAESGPAEGGEKGLQSRDGGGLTGKGDIPEIPGEDGEVEREVAQARADHGDEGRIEVKVEIGELENPQAVEAAGPERREMAEAGQGEVEEIAVAPAVDARRLEGPGKDPVGSRRKPPGGGFTGMEALPAGHLDGRPPGDPFRVPAGREFNRFREGLHEEHPNSGEGPPQALRMGIGRGALLP